MHGLEPEMNNSTSATLNADDLRNVSRSKPGQCTCALKVCQGWDSVGDERWPVAQMQPVGTLRPPPSEEPVELTFEEYHPNGTRYESPQAPIAPGFFPFNRCDVFACGHCGCAVLKYTEYGGYYVDHRVRLVDPDLVVDS